MFLLFFLIIGFGGLGPIPVSVSAEQASLQIFSLNRTEIEAHIAKKLNLSGNELSKFSGHLLRLCHAYRFDPAIVLSLIDVESSFRPRVISGKGAVGLMQILPSTAREFGHPLGISIHSSKDLMDPFDNISIGIAYLAYLRKSFNGHARYYLAAYNAGPARLKKIIKTYGRNSDPYRLYVRKIEKKLENYIEKEVVLEEFESEFKAKISQAVLKSFEA